MTKEERESIIEETIERLLMRLPEVIGHLMASQATNLKLNREFYTKYPDFKNHRDIVASTIEKIEGKNPLLDYKDILAQAVPEIRKNIKLKTGLSFDVPTERPQLGLKTTSSNGEL